MSTPIYPKIDFDFKTNQKLINKIARIEQFKGSWKVLENTNNQFLNELKHVATIQSIGSSTRIEGAKLSDHEIIELIENLQINQLVTRDEQEVIGYWEALELIIENAKNIDLSENYILHLHGLLLKYSDKDASLKGQYKKHTNRVVAEYPDGTEKTIFNTTESFLVSKEMSELVHWTRTELNDKEINPLIVIATFIYEFLSIHPFHDGNGRLSRLLTTWLLIKENYDYIQYVSFEHQIELKKKEYYQVLMEGQKNRNTENEKIDQWILFFLDCMNSLAEKLNIKITSISNKGVYLNERQKLILDYLEKNREMKSSDLFKIIPDSGLSTIKKDLKILLEKELIKKEGEGKGTKYSAIRWQMPSH